MKITGKLFALIAFSIVLLSCGTTKKSSRSLPPLHDGEMRCVGYIPSWSPGVYETVDWNALTHINIAFCNPDTLGNMQNPFRRNPEDFHRIVARAHENGVKVLASLGGGGGGKNYPALIKTGQGRKDFCAKIMDYVREYRLDGVDLDLEEGTGHVLWKDYEPWVIELRKHCSAEGVLLTTAVSTWFSDDITDATFKCFDFINIMAYDGPFAAHSTMDLALKMARHYHEKRGIKPADIVIGVPFYGYPRDGGFGDSKSYRDIITQYPRAWKKDHAEKFGYNGARTMKEKARLARHYGGIMIWELSNDANDSRSLLSVIRKNLYKTGPVSRSAINPPKQFKVKFDGNYEVSGQKFAVKDINPDLPRNWDEYNYVVLEFKITTSQRFQVGFTTDDGYNELRVMSYLPNGWNKLAIPLRFYRNLPDARFDLARTFNQPRTTGWVNLGGKRGELHGVDSIGIRMRVPIGNPELDIRNITLAVDDPGDEYLGNIPVVDEFGQHNLVDYPGKIRSIRQLMSEWDAEENDLNGPAPDYNYSRYGGYKQKQVKGSGFFRTEQIDGRWWFVDPDGYVFLSIGSGGNSGRGGTFKFMDKRPGWLKETPPQHLRPTTGNRSGQQPQANSRDSQQTVDFGTWNLYRRYGENFMEQSMILNAKRMDKWGVNTGSAAFAQYNVPKPHMLYLRGFRAEDDLMGLSDIYAPGFAAQMDSVMQSFLPQEKDNTWIIGYFVGNEPAWIKQELRLCDLILAGKDRPIKTELQQFLKTGDTPERRKEFIYNTFDTFLQTVKKTMKRYDPNHLNIGFRFGNLNSLDERLMEICRNAFDVLSFNCYDLKPDKAMMDRALRLSGLPMIIGEFHFGTVDRGMAQSLWQVNSQQERGVAYRYYMEQGYSHPGLIGTAYFTWNDQDLMGRTIDGENYNCGIVDVTDRPYKYQVQAMMETAKRLYAVHAGEIPPIDQTPVSARGHGSIPDLWNTEKVWEGYNWGNILEH